MQYRDLPRIRAGTLRFAPDAADEQTHVLVGSTAWYALLDQIDSFSFEDEQGRSFTARRERRDQQWYWYAYRKRGKKLHKVYLGKGKHLAPACLQAAARQLADLSHLLRPNSMHAWGNDDMQGGYAAAVQAMRVGQGSGFRSISLLAVGTLAWMHVVRGELHTALRLAREGLALDHTTEAAVLAGAHRPHPAAGPLFLALGMVYYERNRLHLAQQCLEQAHTLSIQLGRADYLFAVQLALARTLAAGRQPHTAHRVMQVGVERASAGRIAFWPQADILAYQAFICLHTGEVALAAEWARTAHLWMHDPQIAQRRIEYWVYAEIQQAHGQYEQAAAILGRLVQSATQIGTRTEPLIKLLVAYASALFAQGQRNAALPVLGRALDLGQQEGYMRPFLDSTPLHTRALLGYYHQKIRADARIEAYVQQVLAASEQLSLGQIVPADATTPMVTLSRREREVLRLVEAGLSNLEIAHKLVIEANTVKSHLYRIYQRFSVSTRYQAVKHARTLQML